MNKIKRNFKKSYIFFVALDVLLALAAVVLLILTLIFGGSLAPQVFSHRVYLMESDAFSLVEKGSAVIADKVEFNEIVPGNIVLYTDEKDKTRVGEVQQAKVENNVYTYTVKNDAEAEVVVGQSRIIGKGMYYSKFIGGIISFVTSIAGVCCLAILPCTAFFIFEIIGIFRRKAPQPTVETVKKQDEIPTYIPEGLGAKKRTVSDIPEDESLAFSNGRQSLMEAAGLFSPHAQKKPEPPKAPVQERRPVLEKDIDKLIKETKAKHMNESIMAAKKEEAARKGASGIAGARGTKGVSAARAAYEQVQSQASITGADRRNDALVDDSVSVIHDISDISVEAERTTLPPMRSEPPKRPSSRVSPRVSRLDSLLKNDNSNSQYDINDILRNIEGK